MNDIKTIWELIITSNSGIDEAQNVEKLREYLKKQDIPFKILILEENGKTIEFNSYKGSSENIHEVSVIFYLKNDEYQPKDYWKVKDSHNLYSLLLE